MEKAPETPKHPKTEEMSTSRKEASPRSTRHEPETTRKRPKIRPSVGARGAGGRKKAENRPKKGRTISQTTGGNAESHATRTRIRPETAQNPSSRGGGRRRWTEKSGKNSRKHTARPETRENRNASERNFSPRGNPTPETHRRALDDQLRYYHKCLRRDPVPLACAGCDQVVLAQAYEKHYATQHGLDAQRGCVWCQGAVRWDRGRKKEHTDHLIECWRQAKARQRVYPHRNDAIVGPTFNAMPLCPAGEWFGHRPTPEIDAYHYTEPLSPAILPPLRFRFRVEALNHAGAALVFFVAHRETMDWRQVMVRAVALPQFRRIVEDREPTVRTLAFSCMCNGGKEEDAVHRHHRHFLAYAPERGYIQHHVMPQLTLTAEERPRGGYKAYRTEPIKTSLHLMNAMRYVSQRKSCCQFSSVNGQKVEEQNNHFVPRKEMPTDGLWALATLYDGGLMEVLHQHYQHLPLHQLLPLPMRYQNGHYEIQVKNLPNLPSVALPNEEGFRITKKKTPYVRYLVPGKPTYFEQGESDEPVDVLQAIRDEWWKPCQLQQNRLADTKALFDRCEEYEKVIVPGWEQKWAEAEEKRAEAGEKREKAEEEKKAWVDRYHALESEMAQLRAGKRKPPKRRRGTKKK